MKTAICVLDFNFNIIQNEMYLKSLVQENLVDLFDEVNVLTDEELHENESDIDILVSQADKYGYTKLILLLSDNIINYAEYFYQKYISKFDVVEILPKYDYCDDKFDTWEAESQLYEDYQELNEADPKDAVKGSVSTVNNTVKNKNSNSSINPKPVAQHPVDLGSMDRKYNKSFNDIKFFIYCNAGWPSIKKINQFNADCNDSSKIPIPAAANIKKFFCDVDGSLKASDLYTLYGAKNIDSFKGSKDKFKTLDDFSNIYNESGFDINEGRYSDFSVNGNIYAIIAKAITQARSEESYFYFIPMTLSSEDEKTLNNNLNQLYNGRVKVYNWDKTVATMSGNLMDKYNAILDQFEDQTNVSKDQQLADIQQQINDIKNDKTLDSSQQKEMLDKLEKQYKDIDSDKKNESKFKYLYQSLREGKWLGEADEANKTVDFLGKQFQVKIEVDPKTGSSNGREYIEVDLKKDGKTKNFKLDTNNKPQIKQNKDEAGVNTLELNLTDAALALVKSKLGKKGDEKFTDADIDGINKAVDDLINETFSVNIDNSDITIYIKDKNKLGLQATQKDANTQISNNSNIKSDNGNGVSEVSPSFEVDLSKAISWDIIKSDPKKYDNYIGSLVNFGNNEYYYLGKDKAEDNNGNKISNCYFYYKEDPDDPDIKYNITDENNKELYFDNNNERLYQNFGKYEKTELDTSNAIDWDDSKNVFIKEDLIYLDKNKNSYFKLKVNNEIDNIGNINSSNKKIYENGIEEDFPNKVIVVSKDFVITDIKDWSSLNQDEWKNYIGQDQIFKNTNNGEVIYFKIIADNKGQPKLANIENKKEINVNWDSIHDGSIIKPSYSFEDSKGTFKIVRSKDKKTNADIFNKSYLDGNTDQIDKNITYLYKDDVDLNNAVELVKDKEEEMAAQYGDDQIFFDNDGNYFTLKVDNKGNYYHINVAKKITTNMTTAANQNNQINITSSRHKYLYQSLREGKWLLEAPDQEQSTTPIKGLDSDQFIEALGSIYKDTSIFEYKDGKKVRLTFIENNNTYYVNAPYNDGTGNYTLTDKSNGSSHRYVRIFKMSAIAYETENRKVYLDSDEYKDYVNNSNSQVYKNIIKAYKAATGDAKIVIICLNKENFNYENPNNAKINEILDDLNKYGENFENMSITDCRSFGLDWVKIEAAAKLDVAVLNKIIEKDFNKLQYIMLCASRRKAYVDEGGKAKGEPENVKDAISEAKAKFRFMDNIKAGVDTELSNNIVIKGLVDFVGDVANNIKNAAGKEINKKKDKPTKESMALLRLFYWKRFPELLEVLLPDEKLETTADSISDIFSDKGNDNKTDDKDNSEDKKNNDDKNSGEEKSDSESKDKKDDTLNTKQDDNEEKSDSESKDNESEES